MTQTVEGAHCVLAGSVATRQPLALINIHAHLAVGRSLEAVVAPALVAPLDVHTLAMATHVGDFQTLVAVDAGSYGGEIEAL